MKLKLDENGHVVVVDGKPVYVDDAGKEYPMDVPQMYGKITSLTSEAKGHREAREALEQKLAGFEGIENAEDARKAISIVKALDEKKLVDAGKVEEIKAAAIKAHEEQAAAAAKTHATELKKITDERDMIRSQFHSEKIANHFAGSKFIKERVAVPVDLFQSQFGRAFSVDTDGALVATGSDGNKIYSRSRPGELADFDEAIEILVEGYAYKDNILKGSGHSGGGSDQNNKGGGSGGGKEKDADFGGTKEQRAAAIRNKFPDLAQAG